MRIIDKNSDFYDYLQNIYYDKSFTFDRTNSFLLTKKMICSGLNWEAKEENNYLLLQICNSFWLFLLKVTEKNAYNEPVNYTIKLLTSWKNYNKKRELIKIEIISFFLINKINDYNNKIINSLTERINTNDYKVRKNITKNIMYQDFHGSYKKIEKNIPLLKACGIANCVNPLDIYLSFEEYFSLEKSSSERREPINITDIDKIESHGFDKKISFRTIKRGNK
jgi:hypothetical protein